MSNRLLILLFAAVTGTLYAGPGHDTHPGHDRDGWDLSEEELYPYNEVIDSFLAGKGAQTVGEITIGELRELTGRLSVVAQEEDYVRRARNASHMMPGTGHFLIDENGIGAAYLTGSILVAAGTVLGAYFVLPNDVQFDELDYIDDSFRDISRAWRGQSVESLWPAFGVLLGGGLVQAILGELASEDAERRARDQLDSGEKRFEPKPFIYPDAQGRLMLGARIGL